MITDIVNVAVRAHEEESAHARVEIAKAVSEVMADLERMFVVSIPELAFENAGVGSEPEVFGGQRYCCGEFEIGDGLPRQTFYCLENDGIRYWAHVQCPGCGAGLSVRWRTPAELGGLLKGSVPLCRSCRSTPPG